MTLDAAVDYTSSLGHVFSRADTAQHTRQCVEFGTSVFRIQHILGNFHLCTHSICSSGAYNSFDAWTQGKLRAYVYS